MSNPGALSMIFITLGYEALAMSTGVKVSFFYRFCLCLSLKGRSLLCCGQCHCFRKLRKGRLNDAIY